MRLPLGCSSIISGLSVVAFSGPRAKKISESRRFSSVHSSSLCVRINDGVIVSDVRLEYTLSHNVVVSLKSEVSEFIGPGGDSGVL